MIEQNWKDLIGKRILVSHPFRDERIETVVIEVSPQGRVKFQYPNGNDQWLEAEEYELLEILESAKGETI